MRFTLHAPLRRSVVAGLLGLTVAFAAAPAWSSPSAGQDCPPPPGATAADATLRRYAVEQAGLRIRPSRVDRFWAIQPQWRDIGAELAAARREDRTPAWLASLAPPHVGYQRLVAARCRYGRIVAAGGWPSVPAGPVLREGDKDPGVRALRERLRIEGYAVATAPAGAAEPPTADAQAFDAETLDADLASHLRDFQRRYDLEVDAVLGPRTREALNVSAARRLAQIDANLERWRWLPHVLPDRRIEVDAGAAEATYFLDGRAQLRMRTIVGDPRHRTPMFASAVDSVVFNPPWNVPASIARNEILPRLARDPGYLARHNIVRTPSGLRQRPGPGNALGFIKFDLPSPFGVYLHDTSTRSLFARRSRTLSHGCIRLEKPRELAVELLSPQGWTSESVEAAIAAGATQRVALEATTPLFVVYRTVDVDEDGWANFRRDPYGWDAKLLAALADR